ncbi:MAG: hypothetical protein HKN18_04165 [Silicimonas sp.]|nr:hypothetical protein [Silicimonas sp.]
MTDKIEDCIIAARAELSLARSFLHNEISNYPTPISGCDAQFNHLLSQRQKVLAAISSLDERAFVPTPRAPSPETGIESR